MKKSTFYYINILQMIVLAESVLRRSWNDDIVGICLALIGFVIGIAFYILGRIEGKKERTK